MSKFQCWETDDLENPSMIEAYDAQDAASKFVEHLDDNSGGEYTRRCGSVDVTVMAPGGLPKRFSVELEARIHYDAHEVI